MTTRDDILIRIANGRANAATEAVSALSDTLASVEAMVRGLRPADAPDVAAERADVTDVRRVLNADLADLQDMRGILDGAGYSPTPTGLRGLLGLVGTLRARVAALTPGPWVRSEDGQPGLGDLVLIQRGHAESFVQRIATGMHIAPGVRWLRIPDGDPAT